MKKTIAVDLDDVLADSVPQFIAFSNQRWGTNLTIDDYSEHWGDMWKVDAREWQKRAEEFHATGVVSRLIPKSEATPVLEQLRHNYKMVIITSRRSQINKETLKWVDLYYSGIFEEVHFAGMWDKVTDESHKATKTEICRQVGADYLIDDQLKHCLAAASAGIDSVLFGNYPWNKADSLPRNVFRADNWQEVLEYFDGKC